MRALLLAALAFLSSGVGAQTPAPVNVTRCTSAVDLVIVVDSSGSIGTTNFQLVKNFLVDWMSRFIISPSYTRVALVTYDGTAILRFGLTQYTSYAAVTSAISSTPYSGGGTQTGTGIAAGTSQWLSYGRKGVGVAAQMMVVTDGQSTNPSDTIVQAQAARAAGLTVAVTTIGPSSAFNPNEIEGISGNDPRLVFPIEKWANVKDDPDVLRNITTYACLEPARVQPNRTINANVTCNGTNYLAFFPSLTGPVNLEANVTGGSAAVCYSYANRNPSATSGQHDRCAELAPGSTTVSTTTAFPRNATALQTLYVSIQATTAASGGDGCGAQVSLSTSYCSVRIVKGPDLNISWIGDPKLPACSACPIGTKRLNLDPASWLFGVCGAWCDGEDQYVDLTLPQPACAQCHITCASCITGGERGCTSCRSKLYTPSPSPVAASVSPVDASASADAAASVGGRVRRVAAAATAGASDAPSASASASASLSQAPTPSSSSSNTVSPSVSPSTSTSPSPEPSAAVYLLANKDDPAFVNPYGTYTQLSPWYLSPPLLTPLVANITAGRCLTAPYVPSATPCPNWFTAKTARKGLQPPLFSRDVPQCQGTQVNFVTKTPSVLATVCYSNWTSPLSRSCVAFRGSAANLGVTAGVAAAFGMPSSAVFLRGCLETTTPSRHVWAYDDADPASPGTVDGRIGPFPSSLPLPPLIVPSAPGVSQPCECAMTLTYAVLVSVAAPSPAIGTPPQASPSPSQPSKDVTISVLTTDPAVIQERVTAVLSAAGNTTGNPDAMAPVPAVYGPGAVPLSGVGLCPPSASPSPTSSRTPSTTASTSRTPSFSPSTTRSTTSTPSVSPTFSLSPSNTKSVTSTPSGTPSVTKSPSITRSVTASPSGTASVTKSPSVTPSLSKSPSVTPSVTKSPSGSPSITSSTTPSPSNTKSVTGSASVTPSGTPSGSISKSVTASASASGSFTPSSTPSASISKSITGSPSTTASLTPTTTGSATHSASGSASTSVSNSPSWSPSAAVAAASPVVRRALAAPFVALGGGSYLSLIAACYEETPVNATMDFTTRDVVTLCVLAPGASRSAFPSRSGTPSVVPVVPLSVTPTTSATVTLSPSASATNSSSDPAGIIIPGDAGLAPAAVATISVLTILAALCGCAGLALFLRYRYRKRNNLWNKATVFRGVPPEWLYSNHYRSEVYNPFNTPPPGKATTMPPSPTLAAAPVPADAAGIELQALSPAPTSPPSPGQPAADTAGLASLSLAPVRFEPRASFSSPAPKATTTRGGVASLTVAAPLGPGGLRPAGYEGDLAAAADEALRALDAGEPPLASPSRNTLRASRAFSVLDSVLDFLVPDAQPPPPAALPPVPVSQPQQPPPSAEPSLPLDQNPRSSRVARSLRREAAAAAAAAGSSLSLQIGSGLVKTEVVKTETVVLRPVASVKGDPLFTSRRSLANTGGSGGGAGGGGDVGSARFTAVVKREVVAEEEERARARARGGVSSTTLGGGAGSAAASASAPAAAVPASAPAPASAASPSNGGQNIGPSSASATSPPVSATAFNNPLGALGGRGQGRA